MTYTEQAIRKAIGGGLRPTERLKLNQVDYTELQRFEAIYGGSFDKETRLGIGDRLADRLLLDPLFWSSLGKALGWEDESYGDEFDAHHFIGWSKWHCFIDHLSLGKDIESFFEALLNNNTQV